MQSRDEIFATLRDALVELFELDSDPSNLRAAFGMGSTGSATPQAQRMMLHSKVLVLDGQLTVIGSMNLDQRSKLQNTEIAVLVRSHAQGISSGGRHAARHSTLMLTGSRPARVVRRTASSVLP